MATATRDAHGRFRPGCSGNPAGWPPGTLNRATWVKHWLAEADNGRAPAFDQHLQGATLDARRPVPEDVARRLARPAPNARFKLGAIAG